MLNVRDDPATLWVEAVVGTRQEDVWVILIVVGMRHLNIGGHGREDAEWTR